MKRGLLLAATLLIAARAVPAQELARIEAKVVTVSADGVYLDVGREANVLPDDRVVLHPAGAVAVDAVIRDVAKTTSRAELQPGSPAIAVGTRAEVLVPKERLKPKPAPAPPAPAPPASAPQTSAPSPPPHPQWTHPPEEWSQENPLLAPVGGSSATGPGELPREFSGRVFWSANNTWDKEFGDRQYFYGSMGTELHVGNPFGKEGSLDLQADASRNQFKTPGFPDEGTTDFNLYRLSYATGGTDESPTRWEVGRFLQHEFPELQTVDGVDWSTATGRTNRFGVNAGAMPVPFLGMKDEGDTQVTVYDRWFADSSKHFSLGGAYQNTWHDGKQDRNLFLGTADYATGDVFSVHSSAWVDYYGSGDTIKPHGFELTEFWTQAFWNFRRDGGFGVSFTHRRIPELLREEFVGESPESVKDGRFDRVGVNGWKALGTKTRLLASADVWDDESDHGDRGELGIARRDLLWKNGEIGASVFTVDGSFSSGQGFRVTANKAFSKAFGTLAYEFTNFDQLGFFGTQSTLAHHDVSGTIDFDLGKSWNLSLLADKRFGDAQDSFSAGFLVQVRF